MNIRAWIAEALGTFVLVFAGSMAAVSANGVGSALGGATPLVVEIIVPFGFGLGLLAAIVVFGHVSGGHFNPAVTLGALFDGRVSVPNAIAYAVAQVVGALAAAFAIYLIVSPAAVGAAVNQPGVGEGQAFAAEALLTAIFVAVILTVTKKQPEFAPLVIALTLVMIHFAAIPISGASVNPARSLGPAIVSHTYTSLWVYLTGPFVGAILGWGVYRFFVQDEELVEVEVEYDDDELEDELEGGEETDR
jgi:aquaporin Z